MKLAGLVVLYNPQKSDIEHLYTYLSFLDKLYIIDNSENCVLNNELLDSDKIYYYSKNENLGMAKALNIGCYQAIEDQFEWIMTMDQDTIFNMETIEEMKQYIDTHDMSTTYIVSPWLNTKLLDKKTEEKISHPSDVMTSGSIMNLSLFLKIGGFKEWLFIDGVDIAYCYDANRLGYHIDRLNYVSIDHSLGNIKCHSLFGKVILCTNHNYIRKYYMQRNYNYLREIYKDDGYDFDNMPVAFKGILFRIIFFETDKIRKIKSVIRGRLDYKRGIKGKYRYKN